jgi:hypothetical protein
VQGGDAHRGGVVGVGLAAVAHRQHPDPGGELGGNVEDGVAFGDQSLS